MALYLHSVQTYNLYVHNLVTNLILIHWSGTLLIDFIIWSVYIQDFLHSVLTGQHYLWIFVIRVNLIQIKNICKLNPIHIWDHKNLLMNILIWSVYITKIYSALSYNWPTFCMEVYYKRLNLNLTCGFPLPLNIFLNILLIWWHVLLVRLIYF